MKHRATLKRPRRSGSLTAHPARQEYDTSAAELTVVRDLELSVQHYANWIDLAPVGFLTLTAAGLIHDINLTGTAMLRRSRSQLVGSPLMGFLIKSDRLKF